MWRFDRLIPAPPEPGITGAKRRELRDEDACHLPASRHSRRGHPNTIRVAWVRERRARPPEPAHRPGRLGHRLPPRAGAVLRGLPAAGVDVPLRLAPRARPLAHLARGPGCASAAALRLAATPLHGRAMRPEHRADAEPAPHGPSPGPHLGQAVAAAGRAARQRSVCRCSLQRTADSPHQASGLMSFIKALRRRYRDLNWGRPWVPSTSARSPSRPAGGRGCSRTRNLRLPRDVGRHRPVSTNQKAFVGDGGELAPPARIAALRC